MNFRLNVNLLNSTLVEITYEHCRQIILGIVYCTTGYLFIFFRSLFSVYD